MRDSIDRHEAIDIVRNITVKEVTPAYMLVDKAEVMTELMMMPPAQPEITDEQAIEHLRESGWMQNHDKQMHEMGLREQLADDSDSYDALLPSAQQEPHWIPCSEWLPEESGKYLVTVLDGIGKRATTALYHPRPKSWTLTGRMAYWKVIAWMPLPEPYQAERREE